MDLIVIKLAYTGRVVCGGSLAFVGALRMAAETGVVSGSLRTFVRPEPDLFEDFTEWVNEGTLTTDDLDSLPTAKEALVELSRFAGDDVIISYLSNLVTKPLIRYHCERLGIQTRPVRLVDCSELAREFLGENARGGLHHLARHFGFLEGELPYLGPFRYLQILRLVALRLWAMRAREGGTFLNFVDAAVMPDISPHVDGVTASI